MSDNTINVVLEISTINEKRTFPYAPVPAESMQIDSSVVSEPSESYDKVFVYDVDDITRSSNEQIEEVKRMFPKMKNVDRVLQFINIVLNRAKLNDPNELRARDPINIENIVDDGIDASRTIGKYDFILRAYKMFIDDVVTKRKLFSELHPDLRVLIDHWECARKCLSLASEKGKNKKYANVALCGDGIAYGAARIGVAGLATYIPIENIYSTSTRIPETVLELLQKRFGEHCKLIVVTSNEETIAAAKKLVIPFWPVHCNIDLEALYDHECEFRFSRKHTIHQLESEQSELGEEKEDVHQSEFEDQYKNNLAKVQALLKAQAISEAQIIETDARIEAISKKEAEMQRALAEMNSQHALFEAQFEAMTQSHAHHQEMKKVQSEQTRFPNRLRAFAPYQKQKNPANKSVKKDASGFEQRVNSRLRKMAALRDSFLPNRPPTVEQYMLQINNAFEKMEH